MAKSNKRESAPPPAEPAAETTAANPPPRRNFIVASLAVVIGAIISFFPFVPGAAMLLDPVLRRKKKQKGEGNDEFVRVASLDSVPTAGAQQYPVIADRTDAWNLYPQERVGAVYLRRTGDNGEQVQAFNAVCPHLGCIYSYVGSRNEFYCPCHNSAFAIDGEKIEAPGRMNPSPRPLDELETEIRNGGEVWVKFQDFYTGVEEKKPKQ